MKHIFVFLFLCILFPISTTFANDHIEWIETVHNNTIVFGDWTPPHTDIYAHNKKVQETIVNGTFTQQLTGWKAEGIEHVQENGNAFVKLTSHKHPLQQTIQNTQGYLMFSYKLETQETLTGFDEPAFVVVINNKVVFSVNANQATNTWETAVIPLSSFKEKELILSFSSGNTIDEELPSWTYLDEVTTHVAVITNTSQLTFPTEQNAQTLLQLDNGNTVSNPAQLDISEGIHTLHYYSEDASGNKEETKEITLVYISQSIAIQEFKAYRERNGEIRAEVTMPTYFPSTTSLYTFTCKGNITPLEYSQNNLPYLFPTGNTHEIFLKPTDCTNIAITVNVFNTTLMKDSEVEEVEEDNE